jgi:hypothetical protein
MAFDIEDLAYDGGQRMLRGTSRAVAGDPYQLRIYVPEGVFLTRGIATAQPRGSLGAALFTITTTASSGCRTSS